MLISLIILSYVEIILKANLLIFVDENHEVEPLGFPVENEATVIILRYRQRVKVLL
jgi:hypothetical protein